MAERTPDTSPSFDRIRRPEAGTRRERDDTGKEALYSTAPSAKPTAPIDLRCQRCRVRSDVSLTGALRLLAPPALWDPFRDRLWARCPACTRRSWLEIRAGQAVRVLLQRSPRT